MMRKALVLVAAVIMLACTLVGCGKKECDVCGETASCKSTKIDGEKIYYCKDCKDLVKGLKAVDKLIK
ncbi:MAG: hypothetical protein PUA49_05145 [Butyrivibrio sp.]|nr:hypothetical protein [Butyrivibrio sp.]